MPPLFLTKDPLLHIHPDIVYSVDPRKFYQDLSDPWEDQHRVPKICGGLFFVRSNERTINLFRLLQEAIKQGYNDQTGVDLILNDPARLSKVSIVGKLPRCLGRERSGPTFCPERNFIRQPLDLKAYLEKLELSVDNDTLRVGLLDPWQFTNAAPMGTPAGKKYKTLVQCPNSEALTQSSNDPRTTSSIFPPQIPIAFHANSWSLDKVWMLKEMGLWFLNANEQCSLH